MAFKKTESASKGSLPFFDKWSKGLSNELKDFFHGKIMTFKHIKEVESGKGFLLNFDDEFLVFVWKHSGMGTTIAKAHDSEESWFLAIEFENTEKGLTYDFVIDEEVEIAVTKTRMEENIFYWEYTIENSLPPIAPEENRRFYSDIPKLVSKTPSVSRFKTTTPKKSS
jgi:hypothetical protein